MSAEHALLTVFAAEQPIDVANYLERGTPDEAAHVLSQLEHELAARVVSRMTTPAAAAALATLDLDLAAEILAEAGASTAALVLARCPQTMRHAALEAMTGRMADAVRRLLVHPAKTAGSIMDPLAPTVADDASAGQALERIRGHSDHALYYVYVTDRSQRLVGVTTLPQLLSVDPDSSVLSVMRERPTYVPANASLNAVIAHPGWRHYHALPVVDRDRTLLGVVRYDTARSIERELGQAVRRTNVAQTAGALAQLYAIGTLGMAEWFTALSTTRRGKPKAKGRA